MKRFILFLVLLMPLLVYAEEPPKDTKDTLKLKIAAIEWEARYCQERMQNLDVQYRALVEQYKKLAEQSPPQSSEQNMEK